MHPCCLRSGQPVLLPLCRFPVVVCRSVGSRSYEQCFVIAIRLDSPVPDEENPIGSPQQGNTVSCYERRARVAQLFQGILNQGLTLGLHR